MNREQYLKNKEEIKTMSKQLKALKYQVREKSREFNKGLESYENMIISIGAYQALKKNFRIKHIFMSLVRGRSRDEIEQNHKLNYSIEMGLKKLCDEHNFKPEYDIFGCVFRITPLEGEATIMLGKNAS